jgi:hypothetical protein
VAATWTLTVRAGSRVDRERFAELDEALRAVDARLGDLRRDARRETARVFRREIEPVAQVAARLELSGPGGLLRGVHGGMDVRGDGSVEAWSGRVRKRVLEQRNGESPLDALRRDLNAAGRSG